MDTGFVRIQDSCGYRIHGFMDTGINPIVRDVLPYMFCASDLGSRPTSKECIIPDETGICKTNYSPQAANLVCKKHKQKHRLKKYSCRALTVVDGSLT